MQRQLNVRISDVQVEALDEAVASGRFPSRAAALRTALDLLLGHEPQAPVEPGVPAAEALPDERAGAAGGGEAGEGEAQGAGESAGVARGGEPAEVVRVVPPGARWLPERFLPTPAEHPALVLARRAAVPLISSVAGALLATLVRSGGTRRGVERSPRRRADAEAAAAAARGTLDLLIVRGRDQAIGVGIRRP